MKYLELETKINSDGKPVYRLSTPNNVTIYNTDTYIISTEGDRFDTLAYKYYGKATLWYAIAAANSLANGSLSIPPGTPIVIPSGI